MQRNVRVSGVGASSARALFGRLNQRADIIERVKRFIEETDYTQNRTARELDISSTTISEILRNRWKGKTVDKHFARIHNWLELTGRRETIVRSRRFVETLVAQEILIVARTVAETCKMGAVFGPACSQAPGRWGRGQGDGDGGRP